MMNKNTLKLILEDGTEYVDQSFGYEGAVVGEVVSNTAMVGYTESLTDPSYAGQILVMTYLLIGNYGIPGDEKDNNIPNYHESYKIHVAGLVVANYVYQQLLECKKKPVNLVKGICKSLKIYNYE